MDVVKIGCVAPLSGPVAHLGRDLQHGALLAVEQANAGRPSLSGAPVRFDLVIEDDAGDPLQAVHVAQKLTDSRVHGVVGHLHSGTAIPASKIYHEADIVHLTTATNPKLTQQGYHQVFRVVTTDDRIGAVLAQYAVNTLKARTIAVIDDRTAYGQGLATSFTSAAKAAGATIVATQFTNDKATDFSAILTSIKSKNPDLLFLGALDATAGPLIRQMDQLGIKAHVMGGDGICTTDLPKLAGDGLADGRVHAASSGAWVAQDGPFHAEFLRRFKHPVVLSSPYAYDAVNALIAAMGKADSPRPTAYRRHLAALTHDGVTGPISFDATGSLRNNAVCLSTFNDGQLIAVEQ